MTAFGANRPPIPEDALLDERDRAAVMAAVATAPPTTESQARVIQRVIDGAKARASAA